MSLSFQHLSRAGSGVGGTGFVCLFPGEELGSGSVHAALRRDKRRAHRNVSPQRLLDGHRGRM